MKQRKRLAKKGERKVRKKDKKVVDKASKR